MDSKDKEILNKLVKIAIAQQKIINKLAQTQEPGLGGPHDEIVEYLKRIWPVVCANNGVAQSAPKVEHTPGSTEGNIQIGGSYTLYASGVPANNVLRQKLINEFRALALSKHPQYLNNKNLNVIFQ